MTKSTLNTKALQSATLGFLAAALVVGGITLGPGLSHAIRGDALAASSQARTSFTVAAVDAEIAPLRSATQSPATAVTNSSYAVATVTSVAHDDSDSDSEFETKDN